MSKAQVSTASSVLTFGILLHRPKALDLNICSRQNEVAFSILVRVLVYKKCYYGNNEIQSPN